jgi:hypothetical protein
MKIFIVIFAIIIIGSFLLVRSKQDGEIPKIQGSLKDIENNLNKLMSSNNDHAFLIVEVSGTENFIQFSGGDKGIQLDFPLVTDHQKEIEAKVRQRAKDQNLVIIENKGSDGSRFLDINIDDSSSKIAEIVKSLLKNIYGVSESSKLMFQLDI